MEVGRESMEVGRGQREQEGEKKEEEHRFSGASRRCRGGCSTTTHRAAVEGARTGG